MRIPPLLSLLLILLAVPARAHDPGFSELDLELAADALALELRIPSAARGSDADPHAWLGPDAVRVLAGDAVLAPESWSVSTPEPGHALLVARYAPAPGVTRVEVPLLGRLGRGHLQYARVRRAGELVAERLLSAASPALELAAPAESQAAAVPGPVRDPYSPRGVSPRSDPARLVYGGAPSRPHPRSAQDEPPAP